MITQVVFVAAFAFNLLLIWFSIFLKRMSWYRPWGGLVLNLLPFFTVFFAQPRFGLDFFWWKVAGLVAIVLGLALMVWSTVVVKKEHASFRFSKSPNKFVAAGPYAFIRHPWYLALVFTWIGWWWFWARIYSFYLGMFILALVWLQAYLEEKLIMEKKFSSEYKDYKRSTGMFWIK